MKSKKVISSYFIIVLFISFLHLPQNLSSQIDLTVGDVSTLPGEKKSGYINVPGGEDDGPVRIPVTIINGVNEGPVLALIAVISGRLSSGSH